MHTAALGTRPKGDEPPSGGCPFGLYLSVARAYIPPSPRSERNRAASDSWRQMR